MGNLENKHKLGHIRYTINISLIHLGQMGNNLTININQQGISTQNDWTWLHCPLCTLQQAITSSEFEHEAKLWIPKSSSKPEWGLKMGSASDIRRFLKSIMWYGCIWVTDPTYCQKNQHVLDPFWNGACFKSNFWNLVALIHLLELNSQGIYHI